MEGYAAAGLREKRGARGLGYRVGRQIVPKVEVLGDRLLVCHGLLDHARDHRAALLMSTHRHESLDAFDRVVDIAAFRRDGETAR